MKKIELIKIFSIGLIAAMLIFGCTKNRTDGTIASQGVSDTTNTIGILNNSYSKPDHWVGKNFPVTWVNRDNKVHSATADDGTWDSGPIQPGTSYTRSFSDVGSYSYHDNYSGARGVLNVFGRDE